MSSILYIVVIAVIAVISNWNKNKGKSAPRGGMPTFGGGGEGGPLRRPRAPARTADSGRPERPGSGFPEPGGRRGNSGRPDPAPEEREYDASPAWPERAEQPSPDYETGEGMSMEQTGDMDGVQARTERMQRELERLQAAFDGMAAAVPSTGTMTAGEGASPSQAGTGQHPLVQDREALRSGLMWAEILGPPRSRQPHASVRKEG
ncbi:MULTISPECIES: hypothetical protein [unclassified Paenibacillus]|uniref:hypothetical protein n=1 Tax=unclassified Paenibacillus TaxID=185978 RepID=UPI00096FA9AF|nr:hypothetical protein [Paenibacillus sp. FSL H8-0259]OMF26312.1 hypothetical protein BK132_18875 [Paenibacillus sp. FSL H8-0259]